MTNRIMRRKVPCVAGVFSFDCIAALPGTIVGALERGPYNVMEGMAC